MKISIFCENNYIYAQGIRSLLFDKTRDLLDSEIVCDGLFYKFERFYEHCDNKKDNETSVTVYYPCRNFEVQLEQIKALANIDIKNRVLVITQTGNMSFIAKIFKAGAKGLLCSNCTGDDLVQAVLTIKNGYDYFGPAITQQLIHERLSKKTGSDDNSGPDNRLVEKLTKREIEIMRLWGEGMTNPEISDDLCISVRTVESHKNHIMQKLNLKNTVDFIKFGIKNNLIDL